MRDYKELLGLVSKVEMTSPGPSVNYVGMEIETGEPLFAGTPRKFPQLLNTVEGLDAGILSSLTKQKKVSPPPVQAGPKPAAMARAPAAPPPQPRLPEPPSWTTVPEIVATQPTKPGRPEPKPPKAQKAVPQPVEKPARPELKLPKLHFGMRLPKPPSHATQPTHAERVAPPPQPPQASPKPKSLEETAAQELVKTVKEAEIAPPPQAMEANLPREEKLILPTLSLIDQVSELDKIIENVKNGRFDKDQMGIVREEVRGLSKALSSEPESTSSFAPLEQDMLKLRRSRLSEALALIQG